MYGISNMLKTLLMIMFGVVIISWYIEAKHSSSITISKSQNTPWPVVITTWNLTEATHTAWDVVSTGCLRGAALDAVEAGCNYCEMKQCKGSIGYGGKPDENGETTLDAMIMDGSTHNVGAVGCLRRIKRAISVARKVMEHTLHTLLVGELATEFAKSMGFEEEDLATEYSTEMHRNWTEAKCQPNNWLKVTPDSKTSCGPYKPIKKGDNVDSSGMVYNGSGKDEELMAVSQNITRKDAVTSKSFPSDLKRDNMEDKTDVVTKCQANNWSKIAMDQRTSCSLNMPVERGGDYVTIEKDGISVITKDESTTTSKDCDTTTTTATKDHDTMGMLAIDLNGEIASGTSTNGLRDKIPGRVGDSPIPGSGSYVDKDIGGAAATGNGDIMIRFMPSLLTVQGMKEGLSPQKSAKNALLKIAAYYPDFQGAIIALRIDGEFGAACHGYETFPFVVARSDFLGPKSMRINCERKLDGMNWSKFEWGGLDEGEDN